MKIGAAAFGEEDFSPSEIVEEFFKKGIHTVELTYNKKFNQDELVRIKNFKPDISIHCTPEDFRFKYSLKRFMLKNQPFCIKSFTTRNIEEGFLTAEKLEATHYVLHGCVFPRGYFRFKVLRKKQKLLEMFVQTFKPLFLKAKDSNVKIVLENLTKGSIFSDVSDISFIQNKFDWLGFCLDFGHSELENQTEALKSLRIDHVHISDNDLKNDSHLPTGHGKLDFDKLWDILKKQRFKGKVLSECSSIKEAIKSVDAMKKMKIESKII